MGNLSHFDNIICCFNGLSRFDTVSSSSSQWQACDLTIIQYKDMSCFINVCVKLLSLEPFHAHGYAILKWTANFMQLKARCFCLSNHWWDDLTYVLHPPASSMPLSCSNCCLMHLSLTWFNSQMHYMGSRSLSPLSCFQVLRLTTIARAHLCSRMLFIVHTLVRFSVLPAFWLENFHWIKISRLIFDIVKFCTANPEDKCHGGSNCIQNHWQSDIV